MLKRLSESARIWLFENPRKQSQSKVGRLKETFRARPVHLMPIVASLLFGAGCAALILGSSMDMYNVAPFPEGIPSLLNALYYVMLTGVGATLLYLLLKRRKTRIVTLLTGFAMTAAVFMLSLVYLYTVFAAVTFPYLDVLVLALAVAMTAVAVLAIFKGRRASNLTILLVGGALGAFLGVSIQTLSAVLILCALAVYDVFAVYHGPVGKIAQGGLEQLRGLSFSFKDVQMGLGDLTFYSMLISRVLADAGAVFCLASTVGVLLGVFLAFKMLERKGMFPGLPFPVAFGLLPLVFFFLH